MRLLLAGCEYAGTTTLADAIKAWAMDAMDIDIRIIHDHFKVPDTKPHGEVLTDEEIAQFAALSPRMTEVIQRHDLYYHTPGEGKSKDGLIIGLHIDEKIYGPLYWGYGLKGVLGDREVIARHIEHSIMKWAPEMVLVHVKASPEVIARRMKEAPHPYPVVKAADIEHVLQRFAEEVRRSMIGRTVVLDTSTATVEETLAEFVDQMQKYLTPEDQVRVLNKRLEDKG